MPTPSPYFESAGQVIDQSKAGLLKAVAEGGTAGKAAFDAAAAQAAQAKQEAVARAAERSALYGVGGNDQTFLGAYDARINQGTVNRTNFESGLAQTQASGESYLEKVRGAIPVHQAININKGVEQETKIKTAIAAAQAKAQADAEKEQRSLERTLAAEARSEARAIGREGRSAGRAATKAAATAAAKPAKMPKFEEIMGMSQAVTDRAGPDSSQEDVQISNDMVMAATDRSVFSGKPMATELAHIVAQRYGLSPAQANAILTPAKLATYAKASAPPQQLDAKALAAKYASKGVTYDLARSVLGNTDYKEAVAWLASGADGKTRSEVDNILRQNFIVRDRRNWTAEYNVLVGEYLSRIPA